MDDDAAMRISADSEGKAIHLSPRDSQILMDALVNPPAPSNNMREMIARYKEQVTEIMLDTFSMDEQRVCPECEQPIEEGDTYFADEVDICQHCHDALEAGDYEVEG